MIYTVTRFQNLSQKSSWVPTTLQLCTLSPAGLTELNLNNSRTRVQEPPLLGKVPRSESCKAWHVLSLALHISIFLLAQGLIFIKRRGKYSTCLSGRQAIDVVQSWTLSLVWVIRSLSAKDEGTYLYLTLRGYHRLIAELLCMRLSLPPPLIKASQAFMTIRELQVCFEHVYWIQPLWTEAQAMDLSLWQRWKESIWLSQYHGSIGHGL